MGFRIFLTGLAFILAAPAPGYCSETPPERTAKVRDALKLAAWREMEPGLALVTADSGAIGLLAFRIDPARFQFDVAVQDGRNGEYAREFAVRNGATLAVNGGFFAEEAPGVAFSPVGYLRDEGRVLSAAWPRQGGFLHMGPDGPAITPSSAGVPSLTGDVIQSKPLLIEPGGVWAMNTNLNHLRRRTIVCLLAGGETVLAVVTGIGMSLFEAGWLMRSPDEGGYFDCDSAIALDGGGSTQLWFEGYSDLAVFGDGRVHNAVIIRPVDQ